MKLSWVRSKTKKVMELRKYNANRTQVLKINQIVRTVSETHKFDKDKLIAINTSDVENGVMGSGTLTSVDELKGQFKKTIVKDDMSLAIQKLALTAWLQPYLLFCYASLPHWHSPQLFYGILAQAT